MFQALKDFADILSTISTTATYSSPVLLLQSSLYDYCRLQWIVNWSCSTLLFFGLTLVEPQRGRCGGSSSHQSLSLPRSIFAPHSLKKQSSNSPGTAWAGLIKDCEMTMASINALSSGAGSQLIKGI